MRSRSPPPWSMQRQPSQLRQDVDAQHVVVMVRASSAPPRARRRRPLQLVVGVRAGVDQAPVPPQQRRAQPPVARIGRRALLAVASQSRDRPRGARPQHQSPQSVCSHFGWCRAPSPGARPRTMPRSECRVDGLTSARNRCPSTSGMASTGRQVVDQDRVRAAEAAFTSGRYISVPVTVNTTSSPAMTAVFSFWPALNRPCGGSGPSGDRQAQPAPVVVVEAVELVGGRRSCPARRQQISTIAHPEASARPGGSTSTAAGRRRLGQRRQVRGSARSPAWSGTSTPAASAAIARRAEPRDERGAQ